MAKLNDNQISVIVKAEESSALDYEGEIAKKRAKLLDYYNMQPYGDEVEGQSKAVTSDVSDVVEWMLPSLIRVFTQGKLVARFDSYREDDEQEADEKTHLANFVFMQENNGLMTLHNMFKDALLQYTGVVKVYTDEYVESRVTEYSGLSELEYQKLANDEEIEITEVEYEDTDMGRIYDAESVRVKPCKKVCYDNIPPEEFLISKSARNFYDPTFIGHRSPKTRSDLIEMGFDRDLVDTLPADETYDADEQKLARYHDYDDYAEGNPSFHRPNDVIYLGEYYLKIDVNGDGVSELWRIFFAGNQVLEKEQVETHPFAVCVPIPIPHRAIGSCPAEQTAPLQYRKSVLVRQMLDNVYQTNYPRAAYSNKVDLDDLLTPRAGGAIEVDTEIGDVAGHVAWVNTPSMVEGVLTAIEYTDSERENRTGMTRYSQGLDGEALNQTATGFKGIMDSSQQRMDLIARIFADTGVKRIFELTVMELGKHQDTAKQIKVLGKPMEIDPRQWTKNLNCRIDVGIGSGDRQEKILNLNNILGIQERFMAAGLVLSDQEKLYKTLEKLIDEVGLKDVNHYFNNPEIPEQTLMAQNQQLVAMVQQLQQQVQTNPLAEAELIKAQAKMAEVSGKETNSMRQFMLKMAQQDKESAQKMRLEIAKLAQEGNQFAQELARDLTKLELEYGQNVPGSSV